jgi:hypothetical protein
MSPRGLPVPEVIAAAVRALVVDRGAERAGCLMGLSPLALAALAAGAFVQPTTLRRARHYIETGERLRLAPPPQPSGGRALQRDPPSAPPRVTGHIDGRATC